MNDLERRVAFERTLRLLALEIERAHYRMLVYLVLLAHLYDLSTFLVCVRVFPIEGEFNPVARFAYESGGDIGLILLKSIAVVLFVLSARALGKNWPLWFAVGLGVVGGLANTASLLTL